LIVVDQNKCEQLNKELEYLYTFKNFIFINFVHPDITTMQWTKIKNVLYHTCFHQTKRFSYSFCI